MPELCVFHIPSSEYIYCHMSSSRMFMLPHMRDSASGLIPVTEEIHTYLLPPGSKLEYDSASKFFRSHDPVYLIAEISKVLDDYTWKGHVMEEFELHDFSKALVPQDQLWREFTKEGVLKTPSEKARG